MNARRRAKRPSLAKRTRLARRALLNDRRRWGAGHTLPDLQAAMRQPDAKLLMAGLRMELLIKHHSIGDGIAYIPYDALGEDAPAPRSGSAPHTAQVAPTDQGNPFWGPDAWAGGKRVPTFPLATLPVPSGLPPVPINAAYWMDDEDREERRQALAWLEDLRLDPANYPHTYDGECPRLCGPCAARPDGRRIVVGGERISCGCCLCTAEDQLGEEEDR